MPTLKEFFVRLQKRAFTRVDIASLVFFRVAFGGIMTWHICWYFFNERIARYWLLPRFLFKYHGFSWVQPWPGNGLYIHMAVLALLAVFIAVGFLYRPSTILFCLGYTYTFLLDEALWVNHKYLICLLSFLSIFVPANRAFSVDAWLNRGIRLQTTPAWSLWLLRAQMGVVYFYAGVAKLLPDWIHGEPMRVWLAGNMGFPAIGRFFREEWMVYSLSYAALLFDLSVVPFLLWRRTRLAAFFVAVSFHLLNAGLFAIGIFPWLAIAVTTIYLSPNWPRRLFSLFITTPVTVNDNRTEVVRGQPFVLTAVLAYIAIQLLVPLRPFLHGGGLEWTHAEHRFTWRMMLTSKWVHAYFYVTDPNTGESFQSVPGDYLEDWQINRMTWRPDMLIQFAHYLAKVMPRSGWKPLRVEARVFVALNGRKPQLFIDQNVDLAAEDLSFGRSRCLLTVHEPLPKRRHGDPLQNPFETLPEDYE